MYITDHNLVGQTVTIYTCFGEGERATVLAVSDTSDKIKVETFDGDILTGAEWED